MFLCFASTDHGHRMSNLIFFNRLHTYLLVSLARSDVMLVLTALSTSEVNKQQGVLLSSGAVDFFQSYAIERTTPPLIGAQRSVM